MGMHALLTTQINAVAVWWLKEWAQQGHGYENSINQASVYLGNANNARTHFCGGPATVTPASPNPLIFNCGNHDQSYNYITVSFPGSTPGFFHVNEIEAYQYSA